MEWDFLTKYTKELERQLEIKWATNPQKAIEIVESKFAIEVEVPPSKEQSSKNPITK